MSWKQTVYTVLPRVARRVLSVVQTVIAVSLVAGAALCLPACTVLVPENDEIALLFYNVENLFDATLQGSEYDEFTPAAGWDQSDLDSRMERLGNALNRVRPVPDIIALVEVENEPLFDRVFDDYLVDRPYPYRIFSRNFGGATGVALASRYPIVEIRTLQARAGETPPLRPVIEARIALPGTEMVVFVNHWKSKRGGAAATEALRRASARLVATRLAELHREEPGLPLVVCGDLNEQPRELEYAGFSYPTALIPAVYLLEWAAGGSATGGTAIPDWYDTAWLAKNDRLLLADSAVDATALSEALGQPVLVSGWGGGGDGSYWYWDHWEQIDHILINPAAAAGPILTAQSFAPLRDSVFADAAGRPVSWFDDPEYVSDHLPVMQIFAINRD